MQAQRFWIERAFQKAKSECGMADYQARKWKAWHHHMALVAMALSFMLDERIAQLETYPLFGVIAASFSLAATSSMWR